MEDKVIWFTGLCGNNSYEWTFWNTSFTWQTNTPDLTYCFQLTILRWIPLLFLFISLPVYFTFLSKRPSRSPILFNGLNLAKQLFVGFLAVSSLIKLGVTIFRGTKQMQSPLIFYLDSSIHLLVWVILIVVYRFELQKNVSSSGVMFIFWVLESLSFAITLYSHILKITLSKPVSNFDAIFNGSQLFLILILFICHWFVGTTKEDIEKSSLDSTDSLFNYLNEKYNTCPETRASFPSRLLFMWFVDLIVKGFKKNLLFEDLWNLKFTDKSKFIVSKTIRNWIDNIKYARKRSEMRLKFGFVPSLEAYECAFHPNPGINYSEVKLVKPSFALALFYTFWPEFLISFICKLFADIFTLIQPFIVCLLIGFMEHSFSSTIKSTDLNHFVEEKFYLWHGIFYTILLVIVGLLRTIVFQHYLHFSYRTGMRLKTAVIGVVYRKYLRLSNYARKSFTTGELINLISVDSQRLEDFTIQLHMIWSTPFLILITIYLLWLEFQYAILFGLLLSIILIPMNTCIVTKMKFIQVNIMKFKDERIKLENQILSYIKIVKMNAWEPAFEMRITHLRDQEVKGIRKIALLNVISSVISFCTPVLVSLVTFTAYISLSSNHILDAQKVFVSIILFNILTIPLSILPSIFATVIQSFVSLDHIEKFLSNPELDEPRLLKFPTTLQKEKLYSNYGFDNDQNNQAEEIDSNKMIDRKSRASNHWLISNEENCSENMKTIVVENATFGWDNHSVLFRNLNFEIPKGKLYAVVGPPNAGKSSLLYALLNEMHCYCGKFKTIGTIAYVSEQPWCQNDTIKNNITFNLPCIPLFYNKVIEECCLQPDLDQLPEEDETLIGERGTYLSKEQRQRICLARALYQKCDIYLFDNALSLLNDEMSQCLFNRIIGPEGLLRNKTRLFVTNCLEFIQKADEVFYLCPTNKQFLKPDNKMSEILSQSDEQGVDNYGFETEGNLLVDKENKTSVNKIQKYSKIQSMYECHICEQGTHVELLKLNGEYAQFYENILKKQEKSLKDHSIISLNQSVPIEEQGDLFDQEEQQMLDHNFEIRSSFLSNEVLPKRRSRPFKSNNFNLIDEEINQTNSVKVSTVSAFKRLFGNWNLIFTLLFYILVLNCVVAANIWLGYWTQDESGRKLVKIYSYKFDYLFYLGIYTVLCLLQVLFSTMNNVFQALGSANLSSRLHYELLYSILRAPALFFDNTPVERILNRFSKDIDVIDTIIPLHLRIVLITLVEFISAVILICFASPWFLIVLLPIVILIMIVQRLYMWISRQLKSINSTKKLPIYSHFQQTIEGTITIRAYDYTEDFIARSDELVDDSHMAWYPIIVSYRWLAINIELIGHMITLIACMIMIFTKDSIGPGFAGLLIIFSIKISNSIALVIRSASDLESSLLNIQKIREFCEIPNEGHWRSPSDQTLPIKWPNDGSIKFSHFSTKYRQELHSALKGINILIKPNEKIGIVGPKGSGRSSFARSLFRLLKPSGGEILIDGVNINKIGLHDLRENLTIIPHEPAIFSETLRFNLDPFGLHSEEDLWKAIEMSHLKEFVCAHSRKLDLLCAENGENMSSRQCKLICLARAFLSNSKVIIFHESHTTADSETDEFISEILHDHFKNHTIITISDHLKTIMNCDKIIVLVNGRVVEEDSPTNLLNNLNSTFYDLFKENSFIKQ